MIDFREIRLSDKKWIDELLKYSDFRGAEYCFTNLFAWEPVYGSKIARYKDFLLLTSGEGENRIYILPAGKGDYKEVIDVLKADAASRQSPFALIAVPPQMIGMLETLYPGGFSASPVRNSFDYIYEAEKMISLSGKKLQPKRNHLARFTELPGWKYEAITEANLAECIEYTDKWCRENGGCDEKNVSLSWELCAVRRMLTDFITLDLKGGLIRLDNQIVAYTVGERLNSDTFIVHIEKADSSLRGAYQAINREFLAHNASDIQFVNREDDAGDEGLRKAKSSYYPAFMQEKYAARFF